MKKRMLLGTGAGIAVGVVAAKLAKKAAKKANGQIRDAIDSEQPPSFFQDLGWRDRRALVLGSTKAWEYLKPADEDDGVYPLAFFECSQKAQYGILRCYFGHLTEGGTVLLVVDPSEKVPKDAISPIDAKVVHELVFRAEGGGLTDRQQELPLLHFPLWSARFMRAKRAKAAGALESSSWPSAPAPTGYLVDSGFLHDVGQFCESRDLKLRVLALCPHGESIARQLEDAHVTDFVFCADAASLNKAVYAG